MMGLIFVLLALIGMAAIVGKITKRF